MKLYTHVYNLNYQTGLASPQRNIAKLRCIPAPNSDIYSFCPQILA